MKAFQIVCCLIFALSLVGCQTIANEGAGYEKLTPLPATVVLIKDNDPEFLKQVAAHNRQCEKDKACVK